VTRTAGEVSSLSDLSSPFSTVDSQRQARRSLASAGTAALCTRQAQPGRSLRRCHLRERGTKIVAVAAGNSLPLAVSVQSASPAECKLVEEVLAGSFLDQLPARLIGDKAYDSDKLDQQLKDEYGIEMIAPNRRNRGKRRTGASFAATRNAGSSNDSSPGCTTSEGSSRDGNTTSKTSSDSSNSPASTSCSNVYETTSNVL